MTLMQEMTQRALERGIPSIRTLSTSRIAAMNAAFTAISITTIMAR